MVTLAVAASAGSSIGPRSVAAVQERHQEFRIPRAPTCSTCRIDVGPAIHILAGPRTGLTGYPMSLAWDGNDRLFVTQPATGEMVWVFDPASGRVDTVGREGSGPGEMRRPSLVAVASGDTLYILDPPTGRISVFDPRFRFVRSARAPVEAYDLKWLPSWKQLLVGALVRDPDRFGLPFHLFDVLGNHVNSFGDRVEVDRDPASSIRRLAVPHPDGGIVAASVVARYRIERWTPQRALAARFALDDRLLARPPAAASGMPGPVPQLTALHLAEPSTLWVLVLMADRDWAAGIDASGAGKDHWRVDDRRPRRYWDTVLDVLDLDRARVITQRRLDEACVAFDRRAGWCVSRRTPTRPSVLKFVLCCAAARNWRSGPAAGRRRSRIRTPGPPKVGRETPSPAAPRSRRA